MGPVGPVRFGGHGRADRTGGVDGTGGARGVDRTVGVQWSSWGRWDRWGPVGPVGPMGQDFYPRQAILDLPLAAQGVADLNLRFEAIVTEARASLVSCGPSIVWAKRVAAG